MGARNLLMIVLNNHKEQSSLDAELAVEPPEINVHRS